MTPDNQRWVYGYDPFGRRVHKINATQARLAAKAAGIILPGDALLGAFHEDRPLPKEAGEGGKARIGTAYQWDGHNLAEEAPLMLDGTALWDEAVRWHYESESFRPLAKEEADGRLLYIVTDHLGTPREMFSEEGTLQWAAEYRTWGSIRKLWRVDPDNDNLPLRDSSLGGIGSYNGNGGGTPRSSGVSYGNLALKDDPVWEEATLQCPIRFQGQWEDAETGLYYNRFRYYDPLAGQYISSDPIGIFGGTHTHSYVYNPRLFIDPLGLATLYRSMSNAEYTSFMSSQTWTSAGTMEGKWFATSYDDALKWGATMGHGGDSYIIAQVKVPDSVLEAAHSTPRLDNIGPAVYIENKSLNDAKIKITWSKRICCK